MFNKISSKQLKLIFVFKYMFQFLLAPLIAGIVGDLIWLILGIIAFDLNYTIDCLLTKYIICGIEVSIWVLVIVCTYLLNLMANVLSILPFCKLILDCIMQDSEVTKEIELSNELPAYELLSFRDSKRFMCDVFSRKRNAELFIYDEKKTKYRVFWNESYGSYEKAEQIICDGKRLKISYFKRSKIIFRCELIE